MDDLHEASESIARSHQLQTIELQTWRDLFGIQPGSSEDSAVASVIHFLHRFHWHRHLPGFLWEAVAYAIREEAARLPNGLWHTYVSLIVARQQRELVGLQLRGKIAMTREKRMTVERQERLGRIIASVEKDLKDARVRPLITAPDTKMLPDWYYAAAEAGIAAEKRQG